MYVFIIPSEKQVSVPLILLKTLNQIGIGCPAYRSTIQSTVAYRFHLLKLTLVAAGRNFIMCRLMHMEFLLSTSTPHLTEGILRIFTFIYHVFSINRVARDGRNHLPGIVSLWILGRRRCYQAIAFCRSHAASLSNILLLLGCLCYSCETQNNPYIHSIHCYRQERKELLYIQDENANDYFYLIKTDCWAWH